MVFFKYLSNNSISSQLGHGGCSDLSHALVHHTVNLIDHLLLLGCLSHPAELIVVHRRDVRQKLGHLVELRGRLSITRHLDVNELATVRAVEDLGVARANAGELLHGAIEHFDEATVLVPDEAHTVYVLNAVVQPARHLALIQGLTELLHGL